MFRTPQTSLKEEGEAAWRCAGGRGQRRGRDLDHRLAAHGPVSEFVPASILQETNCGYHILGSVADDVTIDFA